MKAKFILSFVIALLINVIFFSCTKDGLLPDLKGSLVGYVYTFDEYARLLDDHSNVLITSVGLKPYETHTDNTGRFEFKGLPAGTYELHIEKEGFGTMKQFGIKHLGGKPTVLGLSLIYDYSEAFFIYQIPTSEIQNLSIENDTLTASFNFTGIAPDHMSVQLYFSTEPDFTITKDLLNRNVYLTLKQGHYNGPVYSQYLPFNGMKVYFKACILNRSSYIIDFGDRAVRGIDTYYDYTDQTTIYPNIGDASAEYSTVFP
jgi:hypothetical protein